MNCISYGTAVKHTACIQLVQGCSPIVWIRNRPTAGSIWQRQWDLTKESVQIYYFILLLKADSKAREN